MEYNDPRNGETVVVSVVAEECCSCSFQYYCYLWLELAVLHVADPNDGVLRGRLE